MGVRRVIAGWVCTLLAAMMLTWGAGPAQAYDRDCSDFANQRDAQIFFLNNGGPGSDPHRLDSDDDGVVCETLPCPCYEGTRPPGDPKPKPKPQRVVQSARIVRVVDGDTVNVRLASGRQASVRMIGIDTPERGRCGHLAAGRSLKRMAPVGTRVRLTSDLSQALRDRYGRLLRYVTKTSTGQDLNRAQVYWGWAKVYVYQNKPFERTASYRRAAQDARAAQRGNWRSCW